MVDNGTFILPTLVNKPSPRAVVVGQILFIPPNQKKLIQKISKNCSQMSSKAFLCTSPYGQKTIFL